MTLRSWKIRETSGLVRQGGKEKKAIRTSDFSWVRRACGDQWGHRSSPLILHGNDRGEAEKERRVTRNWVIALLKPFPPFLPVATAQLV